jgi:hypothetical protein
MKTPKPGQFCTVNGVLYRGKKRTEGCKGCALDDLIMCPNITDSRNGTPALECAINDIILVKV